MIRRQSAGARGAQPGAALARARRRHHRHDRDRPRAACARGEDAQRHLDGRLRLSRRRDADAADADRGGRRAHDICDYVRWSAAKPAKIWGLYPRKGVIAAGRRCRHRGGRSRARAGRIDDAKLQSRSKITPWNGRAVRGLPLHTLVRGRFVMRDRALVADTRGWGRSVHAIQRCRRRRRATPTRPCAPSCGGAGTRSGRAHDARCRCTPRCLKRRPGSSRSSSCRR